MRQGHDFIHSNASEIELGLCVLIYLLATGIIPGRLMWFISNIYTSLLMVDIPRGFGMQSDTRTFEY